MHTRARMPALTMVLLFARACAALLDARHARQASASKACPECMYKPSDGGVTRARARAGVAHAPTPAAAVRPRDGRRVHVSRPRSPPPAKPLEGALKLSATRLPGRCRCRPRLHTRRLPRTPRASEGQRVRDPRGHLVDVREPDPDEATSEGQRKGARGPTGARPEFGPTELALGRATGASRRNARDQP